MGEIVKFEDLELSADELISGRRMNQFWDKNWTRLEINLPDSYNSPKKVIEWIEKELNGKWGSYNYQKFGKKDQTRMVIVFENKDEALMFKLRGGSTAWELKD